MLKRNTPAALPPLGRLGAEPVQPAQQCGPPPVAEESARCPEGKVAEKVGEKVGDEWDTYGSTHNLRREGRDHPGGRGLMNAERRTPNG
ncbi:hypothetical protein [Streptomyces sp. NPDC005486]|uniref:hypothetical protein n=1 Tax=Streptomyces sp. NPDC005486 TaxID=3155345 RepID=UPI0033A505FE